MFHGIWETFANPISCQVYLHMDTQPFESKDFPESPKRIVNESIEKFTAVYSVSDFVYDLLRVR